MKSVILPIIRKIFGKTNDTVHVVSDIEFISPSAVIQNSHLHGEVYVAEGCFLDRVTICGSVKIGRYTSLNGPNSDIFVSQGLSIGSFCSLARSVAIQDYCHDYNKITSYYIFSHVFGEPEGDTTLSKGQIIIENDVWVGAQCVILPGAHLSTGVVVGANSIVNSYIPPYAIVAGSPAKIFRYRFSDSMIKKLLEIRWWDWPIEKIKRNRFLFEKELTEDMLSKVLD